MALAAESEYGGSDSLGFPIGLGLDINWLLEHPIAGLLPTFL